MAGTNQPNQFGNAQPSRSPDPGHCAQCEMMLVDALDRTLSPEDQILFDRHLAICPDCSRMFIDAKVGADLLSKLHGSRPEPPAALLERILSSTGPEAGLSVPLNAQPNTLLSYPVAAASSVPVVYGMGKVLPFRNRILNALRPQALTHTFMQPRLAMTAAMAFFSIALTLNLTGIRLTELKASDFKPSSLRRSFYDTNARVVRSIDNLRVVYELESRVRDLQRDNDSNDSQAPASSSPARNNSGGSQDTEKPQQKNQEQPKQSNPRPRSGSSRSLGLERSHQVTASLDQPIGQSEVLSHDGASPQPVHERGKEPREAFALLAPTIFNPMEEGGQA